MASIVRDARACDRALARSAPEAVDREAAVELPLLVDLGDRAGLCGGGGKGGWIKRDREMEVGGG